MTTDVGIFIRISFATPVPGIRYSNHLRGALV
jgi:hypothetical protein